jgi:hypothetical protein
MAILKCANCQAPLTQGEPGGVVKCTFCGVENRIPVPTMWKIFRPSSVPQVPVQGPPMAQGGARSAVYIIVAVVVVLSIGGAVLPFLLINSAMDEVRTVTKTGPTVVVPGDSPFGPGAFAPPGDTVVEVVTPKPKRTPAQLPTLAAADGWVELDVNQLPARLDAFDPVANAEWFLRAARLWHPDARWERIAVDGLEHDGTVDATDPDSSAHSVDYRFYSPSLRASATPSAVGEPQRATGAAEVVPQASELRLMVGGGKVEAQAGDASSASFESPEDFVPTCPAKTLMHLLWEFGMPTGDGMNLTMSHSDGTWAWSGAVPSLLGGSSRAKWGAVEIPAGDCRTTPIVGWDSPDDIPAYGYQVLRGCRCVRGREGPVTLTARGVGSGTRIEGGGATLSSEISWAASLGTGAPLYFPPPPEADDDSAGEHAGQAPPFEVLGFSLGVGLACKGDVLVVAADRWASAWSLESRERLWSVELPGPYPPGPATNLGDELAINCGALRLAGDKVQVPIEGASAVRIDLASGTIE